MNEGHAGNTTPPDRDARDGTQDARLDRAVGFLYDRCYPFTIGGAERYYWGLGRELSRRGVSVTYVSTRYWGAERETVLEGVRLRGVCSPPNRARLLRTRFGARLRYSCGLAFYLLRFAGRFDVVHCCCFPYTALLAARLALIMRRGLLRRNPVLIGDWHEILSEDSWRSRLGSATWIALLLQRVAVKAAPVSIAFSNLHRNRLEAAGASNVVMLPAVVPQDTVASASRSITRLGLESREKLVVFAGRLAPEKRPSLIPKVLRELRRLNGDWRAVVFGQGPELRNVKAAAEDCSVSRVIVFRGFAPWHELAATMRRASVLLLPSLREGFGLIVLEAAAHGLPTVTIREADNAAVELIEEGRNGRAVAGTDPGALARALIQLADTPYIHRQTRAWYEGVKEDYSLPRSATLLANVHDQVCASGFDRIAVPCDSRRGPHSA
jgi:glycosyltransferase involved in cell wall biosynthesis